MFKNTLYQVIWYRHEKRNKNYETEFYQKTVRVFITNMDCELLNAFVFVAVDVCECLWRLWVSVTRESVWEFVWIVIKCVGLFAIWYVCWYE